MASFQQARDINAIFQAMTQRPMKVKIKQRSSFIWKNVNGIEPTRGQVLYNEIYALEEQLLKHVQETGYANEETIALYEKLSRAQSYDFIRKLYPSDPSSPIARSLMDSDGAIGIDDSIATAIRSVGEASNNASSDSSSHSESDMST